MNEEWRQIPDYINYQVSSLGRVTGPNGLLKHQIDRDGYHHITAYKNNEPEVFRVSRLVCVTFNGPCPRGLNALHKDHNLDNNTRDNLYWGTQKQNMIDKVSAGRQGRKLTWEKVRLIRARLSEGIKGTDVATEFGLSTGAVSRINLNRAWPTHLDPGQPE